MAGAATPTTSGRRTYDFQINLVPMIDLLSVLISFLLMTSVWTNIAKIDVAPGTDQRGGEPTNAVDDGLHLTVLLTSSGYTVRTRDALLTEVPKRSDEYDPAALAAVLKRARSEHPENQDVELTSEDRVPYRELIRVMDVCLAEHLAGIRVSGVDP